MSLMEVFACGGRKCILLDIINANIDLDNVFTGGKRRNVYLGQQTMTAM